MHGAGKSEWTDENHRVIAKYVGEYKYGIKEGFG